MVSPESGPGFQPRGTGRFPTTHWSLVISAGEKSTPQSEEALAKLCEDYWYPLYAFTRRKGCSEDEAQDLTQGFFARFLEKNYFERADRNRGRFRSFLLASLKNFIANEWDRARAKKRGGGRRTLSLDMETAEERYRLEPSHNLTPEKIFERRWVLTLLDRVLGELRNECESAGKGPVFEKMKGFLTLDGARVPYSELAPDLGITEGSAKVAVHRLRRRFRELLRAEIGRTVDRPEDVDEEIQHLFSVFGA